MPARNDRAMPLGSLAAAFLLGAAVLALPPSPRAEEAQEDRSAHHAQSSAEAPPMGSEHGGHSGMHGDGMKGMMGGMMEGGGMGGCAMMGEHEGHAGASEGHSGMHGDGMKGMMEGMMEGGGMGGCAMMGGHDHEGHTGTSEGHAGMKGADMRGKMRHMMHEMMTRMSSRAEERIAALGTELKITQEQMPQWTAFADALKSAARSIERTHEEMMAAARPAPAATAPAPTGGDTDYPDFAAVKKVAPPPSPQPQTKSLPERLEGLEKKLTQHIEMLKAIETALEPLYATFDADQKKAADGLMVGPMGVM